ncbi:MAG: amidohydrolase family protein [Promethearchaeota archaeon]
MVYNHFDFNYIDLHCHFFPPNIFQAIWNYFELPDDQGNIRGWPIKYKLPTDELVKFLESQNVGKFTTYNYAHKRGVANFINEWVNDFTKKYRNALAFGCVSPEDKDRVEYILKICDDYDFYGIKLQLLVQNFYPYDERMFKIYDIILDRGKWINFHVGTAPYSNRYVGYKNFIKFIEKYPDMNVIIAHLGTYEFKKFFGCLDKYENTFLDTTMVYIDLDLFRKWKKNVELPVPELLLSYEDRLFYGSDFPNIPYDYEFSTKGLLELDLPKKFYENIFYNNAKRIFKLS